MSGSWASSLLQDMEETKRGHRSAQRAFMEAVSCVLSSFGHTRQMGEAGFRQQSKVMERPWKFHGNHGLFSKPEKSQVAPEINRL